MNIEDTLKERGKRYGDFSSHSRLAQAIKIAMKCGIDPEYMDSNWYSLSADKKEALEMIAHKIARIINQNGDPNYKDSWVDIAGYAQLVADTLKDDNT